MNLDDAKQLLARCAAFDNRQPSLVAAQAWAAALHDLPADDDAFAAIARYYSTPPTKPGERLWIQPHDVRTHRQAIRDERLENFVYVPQADDDDPRAYLANMRAQRRAVAAGRRPADPEQHVLPAGQQRNVAPALALVGRPVPDKDPNEPQPKRGALGVHCPKCSAPIGRHCRWPGGGKRPTHPDRVRSAEGTAPDPRAEQDAADRRAAAAAYLAGLDPQQRAELAEFQQQLTKEDA